MTNDIAIDKSGVYIISATRSYGKNGRRSSPRILGLGSGGCCLRLLSDSCCS